MRVLGLDTSTSSTGYAVLDNGKLICYGSIKPPAKISVFEKIILIEKEIKEIIKKKKVEYIIIEDLAVTRSANTTKVLAGLLYHLIIEFTKQELLTITVRPSQWRANSGIKGKKREELKQNAINHVREIYNLDVNDDEADSICIAEYSNKLNVEE